MKKSIYFINGMFVLCSTTLFASEALTPIAYGVKSLGMGGVSIATPQGAESGFENPALLSNLNKNEVSLGVTATKPSRNLSNSAYEGEYKEDNTYTPYMALNYKINSAFSCGFLASSYELKYALKKSNNNADIKKTRAILPVSYNLNNFSMGISLVAEKEKYYVGNTKKPDWDFSSTDYGYMLGLSYKFPDAGIELAMNYKSKIKHEFFNVDHTFELSSPSEMGIGLHWNLANTKSSIGVDCKRVFSSEIYSRSDEPSRSAWFKDMNVLAVGYSYDTDRWSFRLGYRYVGEMYGYDLLELRNPYMSKSHYTIGGTYAFNKNFSTDIAVVYAPFEDTLSDGSTMTANTTSAALGFNYSF